MNDIEVAEPTPEEIKQEQVEYMKMKLDAYASKLSGVKKSVRPRDGKLLPLITPIDQTTWDAMSGKARWDSIVALRGPDFTKSNNLKYYTTSVIRWRMSGVMRVGGMVNDHIPFVILPSNSMKNPTPFALDHFIGHVTEAAQWLSIPIAYVSPEVFQVLLSEKKYGEENPAITLYKGMVEPFKATFAVWLKQQGLSLPQEEV